MERGGSLLGTQRKCRRLQVGCLQITNTCFDLSYEAETLCKILSSVIFAGLQSSYKSKVHYVRQGLNIT